MSDTQPLGPEAPGPDVPGADVPGPRPVRLRDQVFGFRSLIAVGVAGVVLGGLAGFGIQAATDGHDHDGRMVRFGPGGPGFGDGMPGGPGGGPGGVPGGVTGGVTGGVPGGGIPGPAGQPPAPPQVAPSGQATTVPAPSSSS